jgi:hypothetical protein
MVSGLPFFGAVVDAAEDVGEKLEDHSDKHKPPSTMGVRVCFVNLSHLPPKRLACQILGWHSNGTKGLI